MRSGKTIACCESIAKAIKANKATKRNPFRVRFITTKEHEKRDTEYLKNVAEILDSMGMKKRYKLELFVRDLPENIPKDNFLTDVLTKRFSANVVKGEVKDGVQWYEWKQGRKNERTNS